MIAGRRKAGAADANRGEQEFEVHRFAVLHRVATSIRASTTPEEAAGHIWAALPEVVPCDVLQLCLLEDDGLVLRAVFPADLPWATARTRIPDEGALPWLAIRRREPCLHNGFSHRTSGSGSSRWPLGPAIQSALSAPLLGQQTAIGALTLLSTRRAAYSEGDADWVQALADPLAGFLENLRLRHELTEANLDWEQTFASVEDLLAVINRDGRVLRVNHGYGGRSVEEMVGRDGSEVFAFCGEGAIPPERVLQRCREVCAELTAPDREHALSVSGHPVRGQDGQVTRVLVCARDVTSERRMESQLFQSAKLAAIGEMAAGVAHELNSPLTAMIGNASLLLRRTAPDDKAYRMLSDIKTCGHRCKKIITNLLTFARQDSYVLEPLRLNDVVASAIDLIGYQLSKSGIPVERRLDPGLPAILGNAQQIEQVLVNLLLNARDAVEGREPKAITVTTGFAELDGGHFGAAITVSDTGAGIPSRHRERIFDPFFTTKEATKGTGLGLSVSMGIAKAHGGTLTVESRPGAGSTFALVLPFPEQRLSEEGGEGPLRAAAARSVPAEALEKLRPSLDLARKLGRLHAQLGTAGLTTVDVVGAADPAAWGTGVLTAAALAGLLSPPSEEEALDLAGARRLARERGVRVIEAAPAIAEEPTFSLRVKVETSLGTCTLTGALFGKRDPRLVEIDGFRIEAPLQGHLLIFWAHDRPGLVGSIASLLAAHAIGIRQMRSAAEGEAGGALAVFHVDSPVGDEVLSELRQTPSLLRVAGATL